MTPCQALGRALVAGLALVAAPAFAEVKVALVVGNAAYPSAPLRNPVNDAGAIAARLKAIGFDVTLKTNVTQREMTRAVSQFGQAIKPGSVALFYYAGHGMQVRGRNFLIPVDADIQSEASVRSEAVDLDLVLEQLGPSRLGMVILDACRNNPFEGRFRSSRGSGLAQVDAPKGTLLAYATAPGKVASDGDGANGLYTAELLKAMDTPGAKVEDVFKAVRVNVIKATAGEQVPWESSSLTGDYYFRPAAARAEEAKASREAKASQSEMQAKLEAERQAREKDAELIKAEMEKLREEVRRLSAASAAPAPGPAPTEPAKAQAQPAKSETKPAKTETKPAKAETRLAKAETKPTSETKVAVPPAREPAQSPPPTAPEPAAAKPPGRTDLASAAPPRRLALEQEWKRRFEMVEGQRGHLTLSKALALLLGPFSDEQLLAMVTRERELRDLPFSSAYAIGIAEKGHIVRAWTSGERSPHVAGLSAAERCSRASRVPCSVVVVNGEFREQAFLEWARNAARRPPGEVRAELLKLRPVTR